MAQPLDPQAPAVQVFPRFEPLTLAHQQFSDLFDLFVPVEGPEFFVRVVSLFRDDQPLGGEAPTFQLKAGNGVLTSFGPDSGTVSVPGADGNEVASVTCERLPMDIFAITISITVENAGQYRLRLRNNDAQTLRFVLVASKHQPSTRRPWMVLGDPSVDGEVFAVKSSSTLEVPVRNWGTGPLVLNDESGKPLAGMESSPLTLKERPQDGVEPHGFGVIVIECAQISTDRPPTTGEFDCNEPEPSRRMLTVTSKGVSQPVDPPVDGGSSSDFFCREGCGCPEYLEPSARGGPCARGICGHSLAAHSPV